MRVKDYEPLYGHLFGHNFRTGVDGKPVTVDELFEQYPEYELDQTHEQQLDSFDSTAFFSFLRKIKDEREFIAFVHEPFDSYRHSGGEPLVWLYRTYNTLDNNAHVCPPIFRSLLQKELLQLIENFEKAPFDAAKRTYLNLIDDPELERPQRVFPPVFIDGVEVVKNCPNCDALIPVRENFCKYCKYTILEIGLPDAEKQISFDENVNAINQAFYRLESYMNDTTVDYFYFGFEYAFIVLFTKVKLPEYHTPENVNLFDNYFDIIEQITHDYDKGDFANMCAYKNKEFVSDCTQISNLYWRKSHEFFMVGFDGKDIVTPKPSIKTIIQKPFEGKLQNSPVTLKAKPIFKLDSIGLIFDYIKVFFSTQEHPYLLNVLETGDDCIKPLTFLDNGNRLADAFKQLKKSDIIGGCTQKELEKWISKNFNYKSKGQIKIFKLRYLNDIISTDKDLCKKPILDVKTDKLTGKVLITKV
ncbi:MAG TPA: hypothetical protein VG738_14900 [Chitinophagaceae bacterium]|nr:hypothetical protein [Chitinophagaceae bacterium]